MGRVSENLPTPPLRSRRRGPDRHIWRTCREHFFGGGQCFEGSKGSKGRASFCMLPFALFETIG